jgi:hypothetical protein
MRRNQPHPTTLHAVVIQRLSVLSLTAALALSSAASAEVGTYHDIARRHPDSALDTADVAHARLQEECLGGLKELNFRARNEFDAVAEWSNLRTISLLQQFPTCDVLIMIEVAQQQIRADQAREQKTVTQDAKRR